MEVKCIKVIQLYSLIVEWLKFIYYVCFYIVESPVLSRLLSSRKNYPNIDITNPLPATYTPEEGFTTSSNDNPSHTTTDNIEGSDIVMLFVREGTTLPYSCFGRVLVHSYDTTVYPVQITWKLLDYDSLRNVPNFVNICKIAAIDR